MTEAVKVTQSHFLALPPELRNIIYALVFDEICAIPQDLHLLATCQQIYHEAQILVQKKVSRTWKVHQECDLVHIWRRYASKFDAMCCFDLNVASIILSSGILEWVPPLIIILNTPSPNTAWNSYTEYKIVWVLLCFAFIYVNRHHDDLFARSRLSSIPAAPTRE